MTSGSSRNAPARRMRSTWSMPETPDQPGELKLWDLGTNQARSLLRSPRALRCVAFSPDGKLVAEGGFDISNWPHLQAWYARVQELDAWKRSGGAT